jgi:hypothetical protein
LQDIQLFPPSPLRGFGETGFRPPLFEFAKRRRDVLLDPAERRRDVLPDPAKRRQGVLPDIVWDEPPSRGMDRPKYEACLAVARAASGGGTPDNQDSLTILGQ